MKRTLLFILSLCTLFTLIACGSRKADDRIYSKKESVVVYDQNHKKIFKTDNKTVIDRFAEYASDIEIEGTEVLEEVPEDAQVAYNYDIITRSGDTVQVTVYDNYDYLVFEDFPIIGDIKLILPKEKADWFRNPQNWE